MGDSVTAGFGYYSDGSLMPFLSLYECKPVGEVLDDACSSNSTATKNGLKEVPYASDYGLSNNVSWAAQWANEYGVTNYKNYAVSGSEPVNWAPGGSLYGTTQKIESEDPDYILMTIGANPILANTLFGAGPMECALESDIFGGYEKCVEEAFESVHLRAELKSLYTDLVQKTHATIYLMQYHLSIPSSALLYSVTQIAEMAKMMNEVIAAVAKEVDAATGTQRLQVVSPAPLQRRRQPRTGLPLELHLLLLRIRGRRAERAVDADPGRARGEPLPLLLRRAEGWRRTVGDQRRHRDPPERRRLRADG